MIHPTIEFERRAKMLPVIGPISCTDGTSCIDLYNDGLRQYLTVVGGKLKFVAQKNSSTKWAFSGKTTSSKLTHLDSQKTLHLTVNADKSADVGLVSTPSKGSFFTYDKLKGALNAHGKPQAKKAASSFLEVSPKKIKVDVHLVAPASPKAKALKQGLNDGNEEGLLKADKGQGTGGKQTRSIWRFQATSTDQEVRNTVRDPHLPRTVGSWSW